MKEYKIDFKPMVMQTPRERNFAQIKTIAERHGLHISDIIGRSRYRHIVEARRECAVYFRAQGKSYPEIGRILSRDHTSIMYLCGAASNAKDWGRKRDAA